MGKCGKIHTKAVGIKEDELEYSKKFPVEEKYALTDQIRRSSPSVCANLAEASRKRRLDSSFGL